MRRQEQEPSTAGPPQAPGEPATEGYQPPEISWEEEFAPVADSICINNPLEPGCQ